MVVPYLWFTIQSESTCEGGWANDGKRKLSRVVCRTRVLLGTVVRNVYQRQ